MTNKTQRIIARVIGCILLIPAMVILLPMVILCLIAVGVSFFILLLLGIETDGIDAFFLLLFLSCGNVLLMLYVINLFLT